MSHRKRGQPSVHPEFNILPIHDLPMGFSHNDIMALKNVRSSPGRNMGEISSLQKPPRKALGS